MRFPVFPYSQHFEKIPCDFALTRRRSFRDVIINHQTWHLRAPLRLRQRPEKGRPVLTHVGKKRITIVIRKKVTTQILDMYIYI
jgi:hypothetical protein